MRLIFAHRLGLKSDTLQPANNRKTCIYEMEKIDQVTTDTSGSTEAKEKAGVCAVIVTYHPTEELIENVCALLDQVDGVIVVDNGSGSATNELFGGLGVHAKVSIIRVEENLGIAAALNLGARKAKNDGYQWLATFDQDSKPASHMIELMLKAYDACPEKEKIASLSPRYKDKYTGEVSGSRLKSTFGEAALYAEALVVITSGNLIKMSMFDLVGYFNESLFIDYVDTEYCLRCITQGYKILEVKDAILVHSVGVPTRHKLLWKRPAISNHSALRRYYFSRNAIYVYKRFFFKQPSWVMGNAYSLVKVVAAIALLETDRKKKLAAIFWGIADGLFGRMGKRESLNSKYIG